MPYISYLKSEVISVKSRAPRSNGNQNSRKRWKAHFAGTSEPHQRRNSQLRIILAFDSFHNCIHYGLVGDGFAGHDPDLYYGALRRCNRKSWCCRGCCLSGFSPMESDNDISGTMNQISLGTYQRYGSALKGLHQH